MTGAPWKGCIKIPENCYYLQVVGVVEHRGTFQATTGNHVLEVG